MSKATAENKKSNSQVAASTSAKAVAPVQTLSPPPLQLKTTEETTEGKESLQRKTLFTHTSGDIPNDSNNNPTQTKLAPFSAPQKSIVQKKKGPSTPFSANAATSSKSNGLSAPVQAKMEQAFNADFSNVNIHKNSKSATDMGALAYAQGNDVHFAPGQFKQDTQAGQELIGHELAHVVQQRQGRVKATTQAKGMPVNDNPGLEREADERGRKAAQMKVEGAVSTGNLMRGGSGSSGVVQRAPESDEASTRMEINAKIDAARLLNAFSGPGTTEKEVFSVLNQPKEIVLKIRQVYNRFYNTHTGKGLIADLQNELDSSEWDECLVLLNRAGIRVPNKDERAEYKKYNPNERKHIKATPNVKVAVPGTKINYKMVHGEEAYSAGSRYSYEWFIFNDPITANKLGHRVRISLSENTYSVDLVGAFEGNHKIVCKVTFHPEGGKPYPSVYYEFPQTVVPEGKLASDALNQVEKGTDPTKQLEFLEAYQKALLSAEAQEGSSKLDPEVKEQQETQIEKLKERLESTEGKARIPIKAVHIDRERAIVTPLQVFVSKIGSEGQKETWVVVDITNPAHRMLTGEYRGSGHGSKAAIIAALNDWDSDNRYPSGRIKTEIGNDVINHGFTYEFQTNGSSFWDSISEFFNEVGFWAGLGAIGAGIVTAVAPVPGSRVVSGLIWTSIIAGSIGAGISIAQRNSEGFSNFKEDGLDLLGLAGNILAGTWLKGAKVLMNSAGGTKIASGILIGQFAVDGTQAVILSVSYIKRYDEIMQIEDPKERTDQLQKLLATALLEGGMIFISLKSTQADFAKLGGSDAQFDASKLGNQDEVIDLNPKVPVAETPHLDVAGGKSWDAPDLTFKEFKAQYLTKYPNTTLSHNDLLDRYLQGKRLNPETGRLKTVGDDLSYRQNDVNSFSSVDEFADTFDPERKLSSTIRGEAYNLYKQQQWNKLEELFNRYKLNKGWPPANGGFNIVNNVPITKGMKFDRYEESFSRQMTANGNPDLRGSFTSPMDNGSLPYPERALRVTEDKNDLLYEIEVLKDLEFTSQDADVIPWFDQKGMGQQSRFNIPQAPGSQYPYTLTQLAEMGYIRITITGSPNGKYANLVGKVIEKVD